MSESNYTPKQGLNINLVPFNSINAFCDIRSRDIFLNPSKIGDHNIIIDEISHIACETPYHDYNWARTCSEMGGSTVPDELDIVRRRLGISNDIGGNIGNISGIQNIMTDYVLLQQYRRFTQRILGNEGHWEVLGSRKIRLFPTPKGSFPVVVVYCPVITSFRSPITRKLCMDMLLAESMIMLGMSRNKFSGIPSPDGGTLSMNGADLVNQGMEKRKSIIEEANYLSEPMPILRF